MFMYFALHLQRTSRVPFYQRRGTKARTRYLDIKQLSAAVGDWLSQALIIFNAFTGCDSVSSFSEREKTGPLKQLKIGQTSHVHIHQHRQVMGYYTAGV